MRAIANALGVCIIDAPKLQTEFISLLTPVANQRDAGRSTRLEAIPLEAILNLCHQDKSQIFVAEIAAEANRITKAHGERPSFSAEVIGHRMKKVGLFTRRLGSKEKGLAADAATITLAHKLAAPYGIVGLGQDEKSLRCPHHINNKIVT